MFVKKAIALIFMLSLSATTVYAASYTASDNVADNSYIGGGSTISGVFDLATLLSPSQYSNPYDILSGSINFNFFAPTASNPESVSVTIDGVTKSWAATSSPVYGTETYIVSSTPMYNYTWWGGRYLIGYWNNYGTRTVQTGTNYGGNGSMSFNFDAANNQSILADLSADGKLSYTATFYGGTTDFLNASLTADVNANPVPEPGTMALLGFGMLSLAVYGKRRINNSVT